MLTNVTIVENIAGGAGGGLMLYGAELALDTSFVRENSASTNGGGVYLQYSDIDVVSTSFQVNDPDNIYHSTEGAVAGGSGLTFSCDSSSCW
jgi:hypothetical protein